MADFVLLSPSHTERDENQDPVEYFDSSPAATSRTVFRDIVKIHSRPILSCLTRVVNLYRNFIYGLRVVFDVEGNMMFCQSGAPRKE